MKKQFYLIACVAAMLLGSCQSKKAETTTEYNKLTKVADQLYEVTMDDYCDTIPNCMAAAATQDFGCSAVRNGNFYGRNLDFFISNIAEIVVHTTAKDGRHASLGVCRLNQCTGPDLEAGVSDEMMNILPWGAFDGINDAGLFCNVNVVPWQDGGEPNTGTNPGMPDVQNAFLVRALLDNCATVDEAIAFVNSHNMIGTKLDTWNLHFMIGDPEKTVVLEFIDNKAVFTEQNILTNFYVSLLPEYTPHADGIERYEILKEHYAEGGESMEGMWNLLRRVRFSQAYDPATTPFWKSEYYEGMPYTINTPLDSILADENVQTGFTNFKHFLETGEFTREMGLWYTEHNSTYDIANRKLWVTILEDYDHRYEFSLE